MNRLAFAFLVACGLGLGGCSDSSSGGGGAPLSTGAVAQNPTSPGSPLPPGSTSGSSQPSNGIVGALTGDDDSEVTRDLEDLVFAALTLGEDDEPLEIR